MTTNTKDYSRKYYLAHIEKIRDSSKRYRESTKGKETKKKYLKSYLPLWREKNREKLRESNRKYRQNTKPKRFKYLIERDGCFCRICKRKDNLTINHIIPICIGGDNDKNNLEILCMDCNIREYDILVKKALKYYLSLNTKGRNQITKIQ